MRVLQLIKHDFIAYKSNGNAFISKYGRFGVLKLFFTDASFRRLISIRLLSQSNIFYKCIGRIILRETRFLNTYIFCPNLGAGLYLMHAFSTIIAAKKIGKNCLICQQVTIGWSPSGEPTIGDNVKIFAGAKVVGGITIGNDVWISANAVVTKDVPDHCIVAGIPAKIIKKRENIYQKWHSVKETK